jgi:hypothetical protein
MANVIKLASGSIATLAIFAVLESAAFAGEGGVAGSVSVKLTNGLVDQASSAIAVGKQNAIATASTDATGTQASAISSAGVAQQNLLYEFSGGSDPALGNPQANNRSTTGNITAGPVVVALP